MSRLQVGDLVIRTGDSGAGLFPPAGSRGTVLEVIPRVGRHAGAFDVRVMVEGKANYTTPEGAWELAP